jgi:uncharacterized protein YukE
MEKKEENKISKFNYSLERKKKNEKGKKSLLNFIHLNDGLLSPTNGKNMRILSNDKGRQQSNENLKIKILNNNFNKGENSDFQNYSNQKNYLTSNGSLKNYIKKNIKKKKDNKCSKSVVINSKTTNKLISLRKQKHINSPNNKSNFTNHSTIGNISSNVNQNVGIFAKEIIKFLEEMNQLQINICNKVPNIKDLKKNFEKKKNNLYKEALKYTKNDNLYNQVLHDNRSYNSVFSGNSIFTIGTYNGLNYNQHIKELNDLIITLKTSLEEIKSNSNFITSQLRIEISELNNRNEKLMVSINQYEKNINSNNNSIRNIYKLLNKLVANFSLNNENLSLGLNSNTNSLNSHENKFDYYENEIKKIISRLEIKLSNLQNIDNNNHQEIKSFNTDIPDTNKLFSSIKDIFNEIIEMIRPYIIQDENENELNNIFDNKDTFEYGIIINSLKNLKKYINLLIKQIDNLNYHKETLLKQLNDKKFQNETYKNSINNGIINKFNYNINNNSKEEEKKNSDNENYKILNNDLLSIQKSLLEKLEMKDTEIEKNQETIKELLLINKKDESINEKSSNLVSNEKYIYLLNLYSNEQEQLNQIKNDYIHLIQELSNYIENGKKISIDINKISFNSYKKSTNEVNYEDNLDSNDLGRINENDLLTEKNSNSSISNKNNNNNILNTGESKGSNCATFNKYVNISNVSNKMNNTKHIIGLKIELKQYKNKCEKLNKKLIDISDVIETISNAFYKLFYEVIQYTNKGKELFILVFKLLNYNDDKINKMFSEKEKIKNNK